MLLRYWLGDRKGIWPVKSNANIFPQIFFWGLAQPELHHSGRMGRLNRNLVFCVIFLDNHVSLHTFDTSFHNY